MYADGNVVYYDQNFNPTVMASNVKAFDVSYDTRGNLYIAIVDKSGSLLSHTLPNSGECSVSSLSFGN